MMIEIRRGDRVRIHPFSEEAEVFDISEVGDQVTLGVIFVPSQKAQRFVFRRDELEEKVERIPLPWEDFLKKPLLSREAFVLFVDALRIRLAHTFDPHYSVSVTQVDFLPHQIDAVYKHILPQARVRFLLADDPGLGKTIMAGLVLKELKARGAVQRTLLVVPAHLQDQWKREMEERFREDFVPLNRELLRETISPHFFEHNPQIIVSMDFARKEEIRDLLAEMSWDFLIVDEAHKLSATREGAKVKKTQRYQLGEKLAAKATHALLLTATPHKGDDYAYFYLLNLLEPRFFASAEDLKQAARANGLPFVLRRSKEQVTDLKGRKLFPPREVQTLRVQLSPAERKLYDRVTDYVRRWYRKVHGRQDPRSRNVAFALTILQRRLASSLYAVRESLRRRRQKLQNLLDKWDRYLLDQQMEPIEEEFDEETSDWTAKDWENLLEALESLTAASSPEELRTEVRELEELIRLAAEVEKAGEETKIQELRRVVEQYLRHNPDEKLLIFTEFKDTLDSLQRRLQAWGFTPAIIHGQMGLAERIAEERRFRDHTQVMVATEAAGEGLNLQFCRLMINYDLPWNPNRLEQRMGRIHRYGQTRKCLIFNMLYPETCEGHILERLLEKLERMRERLGESVYDVIGTLLEDVHLEEVIMDAVLSGSPLQLEATESKIEARMEEYQRVLRENALIEHYVDVSAIEQEELISKQRRLVPWDIERFTQTAVRVLGGEYHPEKREAKVFRLNLRQTTLRKSCDFVQRQKHDIRVAFDRHTAQKEHAEFLAPGHPLFEALLDHHLDKRRPVKTILVDDKDREGTLWIYRVRLVDGKQHPALERLVALFHDHTTGQLHEVDPRMLWELESAPLELPPLPDMAAKLKEGFHLTSNQARQLLHQLQAEAASRRQRQFAIKNDWLTRCFDKLIADSKEKLWNYSVRRQEGEDMRVAMLQEQENLKKLEQEKAQRVQELQLECEILTLEPELEAFVLILPKSKVAGLAQVPDEETKRRIEEIGMMAAMDYERQHGRHPVDVSQQFLGYDIQSTSDSEKRFIEVKAFATTGDLYMSPHEWQMAERLGENYWLYIVEQAASQPILRTIQNPAARLRSEPVLGVVNIRIKGWEQAASGETKDG